MPALDLQSSSTALLLAAAEQDFEGMMVLIQDRTVQELTAMLVFCARFSAILAGFLASDDAPDRNDVLRRLIVALARQQADSTPNLD